MDYKQKLDAAVESLREDAIATLRRWVQIPSEELPAEGDAPFGEPLKRMLDTALADAERLGLRTRNFDNYIGDAEMGAGDETMGILAHLDVVPAGDGWQRDPYGADLADGRIYGRGTSDDKGPAVAALFAMRAVLSAGVPLTKRVRLILGCDEESGWEDIRHYKARETMPDFGFSPDAVFPVINTEKGIARIDLRADLPGEAGAALPVYCARAGERQNVIPGLATAEIGCGDLPGLQKALAETGLSVTAEAMENGHVLLTSVGTPGHASMPQHGKNAAGQLLLALDAVGAGGGSRAFIHCLAQGIGLDATGRGLGVDGRDGISGPLTLNLGILRIGEASASATLDIRYPALMSAEMIAKIIGMRVREAGIAATLSGNTPPLHVPAESTIVRSLLAVYGEITGQVAEAIAIGGGTYSRSMDNCVAFGSVFPGEPDLAHQAGEYISVDSFLLNIRIFAHAIARLCGPV